MLENSGSHQTGLLRANPFTTTWILPDILFIAMLMFFLGWTARRTEGNSSLMIFRWTLLWHKIIPAMMWSYIKNTSRPSCNSSTNHCQAEYTICKYIIHPWGVGLSCGHYQACVWSVHGGRSVLKAAVEGSVFEASGTTWQTTLRVRLHLLRR